MWALKLCVTRIDLVFSSKCAFKPWLPNFQLGKDSIISHHLDCCKTVKLIKHLGNVHKMSQVWFPFSSVLRAVWVRTGQTLWLQHRRNTHSHTQTGLHNLCSSNDLPYQSIHIICHRKNIWSSCLHWLYSTATAVSGCPLKMSISGMCITATLRSLLKRAEHVVGGADVFRFKQHEFNLQYMFHKGSERSQSSVELGHLGIFPIWTCVTKASDAQHKVLRFSTRLMWSQVMQRIQ